VLVKARSDHMLREAPLDHLGLPTSATIAHIIRRSVCSPWADALGHHLSCVVHLVPTVTFTQMFHVEKGAHVFEMVLDAILHGMYHEARAMLSP